MLNPEATEGGYRWREHFTSSRPAGLKLPPFKYGCCDLFLPFEEVTIELVSWDFYSNAYGVRMGGIDGVEILMFPNILQWAAHRSEILDRML